MRNSKIFLALILVLCLLFLLPSPDAGARAGGAGGSSSSSSRSSSGGSGGGDIQIIFALVYLLVETIGLIPTLILLLIIGLIVRWRLKKYVRETKLTFRNFPVRKPLEKVRGYKQFIEKNPHFDETEFLSKVSKAFLLIQESWSSKNLSGVRRFISDGVYRRFSTQFTMMNLLKQDNRLSDVRIRDMHIERFEEDGDYDIAHICISASLTDEFVCGMNPALNTGGPESFSEYWSFLRKRGREKKDIYDSDLCPSCSAPLPSDVGEVAKCGYCNAMVNSGEFDWVLSEITQADDYSSGLAIGRAQNLKTKTREVKAAFPDFSVQLAEDRASNAYLQILTAFATGNPAVLRRFVSESAFEKIGQLMPKEKIVYNRLFLKSVVLIGAFEKEGITTLLFSITSSSQRALLTDSTACRLLDPVPVSKTEVLVMQRERGTSSKGSLYMHSCPSCGGPLQDTLDLLCGYCGSSLNDRKNEWIVSDLLDPVSYSRFYHEEVPSKRSGLDPRVLESLYDVKDYALNNIMIVLGADGKFDAEEEEYIRQLASTWKFDQKKIRPLYEIAKSGRLVIRMPDEKDKRRKIYNLMNEAALADGDFSEEEMAVIDFVKENYFLGETA